MNHLANSSSPYLLQHASNPVDWYPWSEEAFQRARVEEKPIFLSIGYSTCHWCHVMAHESFENRAIAALLNQDFICIKVDREERPDVDRLYMSYVQSLTGRGGWPMSVWLTPELKPFFGGTYFPPDDQYGHVGFSSVLIQLSQLWREHRGRLEQEAEQAIKALQYLVERRQEHLAMKKEAILYHAYEEWAQSFDATWGGFGRAPKFPRPSILLFLLCYANNALPNEAEQARAMVVLTLQKMADGGLQDHLGGGFHRYSVDRIWKVPHFEKMLYDQAQLVVAYLTAAQQPELQAHSKAFLQVVRDTLDYVLRDLTSPEGGFYAAEDADSKDDSGKKQEGAFYVWSFSELEQLLLPEELAILVGEYHLASSGNVPEEYDPHQELAGKNILNRISGQNVSFENDFKPIKSKLFAARLKRSRPHRDEKIVTAWNGLMITAFVKAGMKFNNQHDLEVAQRAALFIKKHLYDSKRGTLFRSWYSGKVTNDGFAEDYAFFIQGLLDLYEANSDVAYLTWAEELQEKMNELFWDQEQGGYFSSAAGDPHLLVRMKEDHDGAEPAANSVAASNLLRFRKLSSAGFRNALEIAYPFTSPTSFSEPLPTSFSEPSPTSFSEPLPTSFSEPLPTSFSEPSPTSFSEPSPTSFAEPSPTSFSEPLPTSFSEPSPTSFADPSPTSFADPSPTSFAEPSPTSFAEPSPTSFAEPSPTSFSLRCCPSSELLGSSEEGRTFLLSRLLNGYEIAEQIFRSMTATLTSMPTALPHLLIAMCDSLQFSSEERVCKDDSCNVQ